MGSLLVADIGGTHARFSLAIGQPGKQVQLTQRQAFLCSEFESFQGALERFLNSISEKPIRHAAIAIAGPISGDFARMTNLHWEFSASGIKQQFNFDTVTFVNDLAAQGLAAVYVKANELCPIKLGNHQDFATRAIIGPGTGLGVASLHWHEIDGWRAFPTEGGHIAFAPGDETEDAICQQLRRDYGYVSLEMLLSGNGLVNIYRALASLRNNPALFTDAKEILTNVKKNTLCAASVKVLTNILGSATGDIALAYGAKGGVYLGGGMTHYLLPFIDKTRFVARFVQRGFRNDYLSAVPVNAILHQTPGLLGAALWYYQHINDIKLSVT